MKKLLIICLALLTGGNLFSQTNNVRTVEGELMIGIMLGDYAGRRDFIGAEIRVNYPNSGFDIGLQLNMAQMEKNLYYPSVISAIDAKAFTTFFDYNWRKLHRRISPFAGLGIGITSVTEVHYPFPELKVHNQFAPFCLTPRIGAEFFNHLRITMEYRLMPAWPKFGGFSIVLGGVFGGGPKKTRPAK